MKTNLALLISQTKPESFTIAQIPINLLGKVNPSAVEDFFLHIDGSIAQKGLQTGAVSSIEHVSFNLFLISGPILYPLKTPGDFGLSDVF